MVKKFTQSRNFTKAVNKLDEFKFSELQKIIKKILDNPYVRNLIKPHTLVCGDS